MANKLENTDTLYSESQLTKIIKKYEELLSFLRRKLGDSMINKDFGIKKGDYIVNIKRCLIDGENKIFWDYLCATHGIMEEEMGKGNLKGEFNINDGIGCTKLIFASGKEVIFTRESLLHKLPKGVIPLDKYFYELKEIGGIGDFTSISNEIYKMEVKHFRSKSYLEQKDKIMKSSKEQIISLFNITN